MSGSAQQVISNATKEGKTIIGDQPWVPVTGTRDDLRPKVIYGPDDRRDVYQTTSSQLLALAASTCGLTDSSSLTNNGNGTFTLSTSAYTVSGLPACAGEPYGTQPVAMWCSGFMVGYDLVATAGHCFNLADIGSVKFVFGFQMNGPSSPVTTVSSDQVYTGVALVGRQLIGDYDYSVVRVDRKIVSPGAVPLTLRRASVVPNNINIGVIGHPSGLPLKIAFGGTTRVYDNTNDGYFVANLDTYGGNSGSPVFNAASGVLEGILVRGQDDFVTNGSCFTSNMLADSPGGEEVSKATSFMKYVPGASFNQLKYKPAVTAGYYVVDDNLAGSSLAVTLTSSSGDSESSNATDPDNDNTYNGNINLSSVVAPITPANGVLEVRCGDVLTLTYSDTNAGASTPAVFTSQATVDCFGPVITQQSVANLQPDAFNVTFQVDEPVTATVQVGTSCGSYSAATNESLSSIFAAGFSGLQSCTPYFYRIIAADEAGNTAIADNGGNCYTTRTLTEQSVLVENFDPAAAGWSHSASPGTDNWLVRTSPRAVSGTSVYSYSPGTAFVTDASLVSPSLPAGAIFSFYHTYQFESPNWDAGRLEYRTAPINPWTDMGSRIMLGGYNGTVASGSALAGQAAWTAGTLGAMTKVIVDFSGLPANTQVRFRFASDSSVSSTGWEIDDLKVGNYLVCTNAADDWALLE